MTTYIGGGWFDRSWEWNKFDPSYATLYEIMPRKGFNFFAFCPCGPTNLWGCCEGEGSYKPGVMDPRRPPHFADKISEEDWKIKLDKLNQKLTDWWMPGSTVNLLCSSLPCLLIPFFNCLASRYDEEGWQYCCFYNGFNKRRIEAKEVLDSLCNELSDNNLTWSVEFHKNVVEDGVYQEVPIPNGEPVSTVEAQELFLNVKLRYPIEPFTPPAPPPGFTLSAKGRLIPITSSVTPLNLMVNPQMLMQSQGIQMQQMGMHSMPQPMPQPMQPMITCNNGHPLQAAAPGNWLCNASREPGGCRGGTHFNPGSPTMRYCCKSCDFDYCQACYLFKQQTQMQQVQMQQVVFGQQPMQQAFQTGMQQSI
jgi:hypothetical protein